jgi:hypothetical protein
MRRGLTNKVSFIFILIVSIATLFSYMSDQLAINIEDKLRKNKIEYENHLNKLYKYNAIDNYILQLDTNIGSNIYPLLLKRNFYIKQLLIIDHEKNTSNLLKDVLKNEKGKYTSISSDNFFSKKEFSLGNIRWNIISEVFDLIEVIEAAYLQYDLFYRSNEKEIKEIAEQTLSKDLFAFYRSESQETSIRKLKGIKKTEGLFFGSDTVNNQYAALDNFSLDDWVNVYRYKMTLLKNLKNKSEILGKFNDITHKKIEILEEQQETLFSKIKKLNGRKNFFILFSVVFQVLALLFLLLLFKNILKMKTN